jgi:hypothetical protein
MARTTVGKETNFAYSMNLQAGNIANCLLEWQKITSDPVILGFVKGYDLELDSIPSQFKQPPAINFSNNEKAVIDREIDSLLCKGVIEPCLPVHGQYLSNVFVRPKKGGDFRFILNLSNLNEHVTYMHFKMDTIYSCIDLVQPGSFLASLDLRDAYYSVPIAVESRKFLRFIWGNKLYQYTSLPNGLSSAPRLFTKLLKPVMATLRNKGLVSSIYIDDLFLQAPTKELCLVNIESTCSLLRQLGFFINFKKSVMVPTQRLQHLGFLIDTTNMTLSLPVEKIHKLKASCLQLKNELSCSIRQLAQVIGLLVSCIPAVRFGKLHYRQLEIEKIQALKLHKGCFDAPCLLSNEAKLELDWWLTNADKLYEDIVTKPVDIVIFTDSSLEGWGAIRGPTKAAGHWSVSERQEHINILELKACLLGLKSLCKGLKDLHIQVQMDNTTAITYLNNMGGTHSLLCNLLAKQIWAWAIKSNIWLSATHIPGRDNSEADKASREFNDRTEWMLNKDSFSNISRQFGTPIIDLFASRLNAQVGHYYAWKPDPGCIGVDAFSHTWNTYDNNLLYAFPPFSLMHKVLKKITEDEAEVIVVAPLWPTQSWFPRLLQLLCKEPLILRSRTTLLRLPHKPDTPSLLGKKLQLMACHLSGVPYRTLEFHKELRKYCLTHADKVHGNNTRCILINGSCMQIQGMCIPCIHE